MQHYPGLFYVLQQQQSWDHDESFLLTEGRAQGNHPSNSFHQQQLSREKKGRENENEAKESKPVQEGERGAGENSRWMLSGLRGQHVLH